MSGFYYNSPHVFPASSAQNVFPNEPMNLGSPTTPQSSSTGPQFLPSFLMGDSHNATPTGNLNFPISSVEKTSFSPSPQQTRFIQPRLSDMKSTTTLDRSARRHASPPTQSLWTSSATRSRASNSNDQFNNFKSPIPDQLLNSPCGFTSPFSAIPQSFHGDNINNSGSPVVQANGWSNNQGEEANNWITVFGYPTAQASFILQQFSHFGTILKYLITNDGNWMHIQYQNTIQAKCALNKNGRVFPGNIMIGVRRCTDTEVMRSSAAVVPGPDFVIKSTDPTAFAEDCKLSHQKLGMPPRVGASVTTTFKSPASHSTFQDSPLIDLTNRRRPGGDGGDMLDRSYSVSQAANSPRGFSRSTGLQRHSSMRPLAAAYQPPRIAVSRNGPSKSFRNAGSKPSGLFSKAIDYVFGWN